jgi:hypothetical protein
MQFGFILLSIVSSASVLNPRFPLFDDTSPAHAAREAGITQAPSPALVNHNLAGRASPIPTLLSCATPCIQSVLTNCQFGDYSCECESVNLGIIEINAYPCLENGSLLYLKYPLTLALIGPGY